MRIRSLPARILTLILAGALVAGCAPKDEAPARKAIDQIEAAITAAGPDSTKYLPGRVTALKTEATNLKIKFYDKDYKGILDAAPPVLERARNLGKEAAAMKAEIAASLAGEWTNLEKSVPEAIAAVDRHVDELLKSGKLPANINKTVLDSAKIGITEQKALWEKAVAAKAADDIVQAVTIGAHVQRKAETLLAALGGSQG